MEGQRRETGGDKSNTETAYQTWPIAVLPWNLGSGLCDKTES